MNTVVILSYFFPPDNAIGGQRPFGFAKYLPQYGWEPIVITAKNSDYCYKNSLKDVKIIETKYKDPVKKYKSILGVSGKNSVSDSLDILVNDDEENLKNKLYRCIRNVLLYPDKAKGWNIKSIFNKIENIQKNKKINCLISTGPPQYSHIIAKKIYKKYNIPYIIDFRDLWSMNPYRYEKSKFLKKIDNIIEKSVIKYSSAITTVSKTWANDLEDKYSNKIIKCIRNGFNPEEYTYQIDINKSKPLVITYAGSLYNGKRDFNSIFKAINNLKNNNLINKNDIKIVYFGKGNDIVKSLAIKYSISDYVDIKGYRDRQKVLDFLHKKTDILLFLNWDNKKEAGTIAGKLYEYFAIKKPVLGIGYKKGEAADLINNYPIGDFFSTNEIANIEYYLKEYINHFDKKYDEMKNCNLNLYTEKFNRKKQVEELVEVLNFYV